MTVINPNSISGITSITLPAGADNVLTIHSNDGTERFRIDSSGNVKVGSACTISQDGDVFFTGVCTATTLAGSGANLTALPAANITGTLPAISAANLTNVPAANITGTLPAIDGSNLTGVGGTDFIHAEQISVSGVTTSQAFIPSEGQLSHRNIIINGAMEVAQRATTSTDASVSAVKTIDRMVVFTTGGNEAPTQSQEDVASGTTPYTLGFRKCLRITNGNQSAADAGDYLWIRYIVEAQDLAKCGWNYTSTSSFVTLSFWVKSSVAQDFKGYLRTKDGTKQGYAFSTGALSANTWTKITKVLPGASGIQFDNDNGSGLDINIAPFFGTNYSDAGVTEHVWTTYVSGNRTAPSTDTWWLTNDATWEITGLQLEVGQVATPFEHRSFADELSRCQRYYYKTYNYSDAPGTATFDGMGHGRNWSPAARSSVGIYVNFPVRMRATPTLTFYAGDGQSGKYSTGSTVGGTNLTTESTVGTDIDESETGVHHANFTDAIPALNLYAYHITAEAEL